MYRLWNSNFNPKLKVKNSYWFFLRRDKDVSPLVVGQNVAFASTACSVNHNC